MAFIWHNYGNISHYSYGIEKYDIETDAMVQETSSTLRGGIANILNEGECERFLIKQRWEDGKIRCPYCNS
ncbi:MAG: hypothetical protein ACI9CD_001306 [Candidatus Deianiraeaceae bacterium]|jgi:hypothetical protein